MGNDEHTGADSEMENLKRSGRIRWMTGTVTDVRGKSNKDYRIESVSVRKSQDGEIVEIPAALVIGKYTANSGNLCAKN